MERGRGAARERRSRESGWGLRAEVRGRRGMTSGVTLSAGRSGGDAGERGLQAERGERAVHDAGRASVGRRAQDWAALA